MHPQITTTVEDGYVRIAGRGRSSVLAVPMLQQAVIASLANNVTRIHFHLCGLQLDDSFMSIIQHGHRAKQMGLGKPYRLAACKRVLCDKMRFIELTAEALGFDAKVFADPESAVAWLKS